MLKVLTDSDKFTPLFTRQLAELAAADGDQAIEEQLMALILESVLQLEEVKQRGRETTQMKADIQEIVLLQVLAKNNIIANKADFERGIQELATTVDDNKT